MATSDDKAAKTPAATATEQPAAPTRYTVLSGGVAGVGGVPYDTHTVLTAEQIGDQARIDKLLARGSIAVTTDAADK
jgi:hypothetical protein